jgi:hypothetical protein
MSAARSSWGGIGRWEVDVHYAIAIGRVACSCEVRLGDGVELG